MYDPGFTVHKYGLLETCTMSRGDRDIVRYSPCIPERLPRPSLPRLFAFGAGVGVSVLIPFVSEHDESFTVIWWSNGTL
jgi:hypothetical protein